MRRTFLSPDRGRLSILIKKAKSIEDVQDSCTKSASFAIRQFLYTFLEEKVKENV